MNFSTIGFVGLGLIGGSIAKAIKEFHPNTQILAYTRNPDTLIEAANEGTVDLVCTGVDHAFSECDLIFLCAPVETNARYLEELKPHIKEGCILTDVGSTKSDIHAHVTALGLDSAFIGGHPMAGSEKTGYQNSKRILIENAYYIVTPGKGISKDTTEEFVNFITSLKALPFVLDPIYHDHVTAVISHLPHLIASSLVNLVKDLDDDREVMKQIAAGGFKDITRIASSSPEMWEQICTTNATSILEVLDIYLTSLEEIKTGLLHKQSSSIYDFFEKSRDYRDSIPNSSLGPIKKSYTFYCDLVDETGGIATLATILASNNISLKNIGIVNNREFEEAVLKVELYDEKAYEKAIVLLRKYRYTVYEH